MMETVGEQKTSNPIRISERVARFTNKSVIFIKTLGSVGWSLSLKTWLNDDNFLLPPFAPVCSF